MTEFKSRLGTIAVLTAIILSSFAAAESAQAKSTSTKINSRCILDDDCVYLLDYDSPGVVLGERVSFAVCLAKKGKFNLEFQSNWSGKTFATWIKAATSVSILNLKACDSERPYLINFRFIVSKKTTSLGRVEYRVKVGKAIPLGKWVGIGYSTSEEALLAKVPAVGAPASLSSQVSDLPDFINKYAQSVVTVYCNGVQGSGVSVPFGATDASTSRGFQSKIITNEHVIFDCLTLDNVGKDVVVTVFYKGVEYVGYATTYPSWNSVNQGLMPDLAAIMTTALVPQSSYWNVPQPTLGHAVVAVGSAGGVPNVTTRGEIAGITTTKIVTTAPAGHGSSGGALFNSRGQLLGFITAANASLVEVTPISELCKFVFACSTPIAFLP